MLLPDNIHPEDSVYYNGSFVLKVIHAKPIQDILELYKETRNFKEMTFPVFLLCLDWLYLLNLVKLNPLGKIELCS
ncbi:MAG: hypothetical protein A2268_10115 [Candidatus Raymondbacteria bacterium RifOxyA12_full_50_37]|uniref:Uncharacterized protein n=1 Tax=Candidatus Raymondbacteria bacterium RIFOXYD12_FULL_49_13 TaxID=1817890 RepID=A0A1F7F465_UNCRA|nr:MAG: hypothetical protein A2268_10115 [Candidatus Raymondbacteria bacterium RifOxyA12_full_50_37]OGJ92408.1 MAG: hypothetical protein A2350_03195 [Candidatus Raymondbacteria bacterium RifOxyB12_full_50_8]OGJ93808.1 MAG: hypothetical protein A2248_06185 [Candidatus Raymondbacteria bacterium RIFOXYA2_FULL_49_16]OGJ94302.1 MAG: hypothetical protein A2487_17475 [Candidatus Raymondbacteria bacterium RifOxyC12_full_50_8]OGJ98325.1 MAG: hypothetical protein A2453_00990 [Candidatus Raymondbacteria b